MTLREDLSIFFRNSDVRKVVLIGVGNASRRDDAVGPKIIELLRSKGLKGSLLLNTETVPENYTGSIRDYFPTRVLLIDAAHFDGLPGEGRIIPAQMIGNVTVSTHAIPLDVLIGYITKSICDRVALLGIQVKDTNMGEGLTPEVERGAEEIANILFDILNV